MTLKLYQRRILFSLLILSIILCGISFIFPTVEVANIDGTENLTFFLWGGQWNIKQNDFPFPKLFLYPSMVGPLRELASSIPAGDSYKDIFNSVKTQIVGYIFLTLTLLLFVLALIFGIKGLFHMYRGDIKKEQSWVFSSGVTAILAIVLYFVIMSFIILPPSNVSYNISHVSWGAGFYLFLFGGVMLTFVGSRGYLIQINEELKKDISEDPKTAKTKKADVVYKTEKEKKDKKTEYPVQQNPWKPRTKIITVVAIIIVAVIIAAASLVLFTAGDTHKFVGTWVGTESGSTTFLFFNFPWTKQDTFQFKSDGTVIMNQETTTITGTYKINDGTLTLNLHGQSGLCSYSFSNNDRTLILIPLSSSGNTLTLYKQ